MKKSINSKILNGLIIFGIVLTIVALVGMPLVLTAALKVSGMEFDRSYSKIAISISILIYICAVPYVIALLKLKSICKALTGENSFALSIAEDFKIVGICAFVEAVTFIGANLILYFVYHIYLYALTIIPLFVVPFIAITLGFLFLTMSNVFKKASEIKEENDLTF